MPACHCFAVSTFKESVSMSAMIDYFALFRQSKQVTVAESNRPSFLKFWHIWQDRSKARSFLLSHDQAVQMSSHGRWSWVEILNKMSQTETVKMEFLALVGHSAPWVLGICKTVNLGMKKIMEKIPHIKNMTQLIKRLNQPVAKN